MNESADSRHLVSFLLTFNPMETNTMITRRDFLQTAALGAAALTLAGPTVVQAATDLRRYEPNLRDRLWMWGDGPGTLVGRHSYNIPFIKQEHTDLADAIDYMGIPNVCVVRWMGKPEPPFDEYIKQFHKTKRVGWTVIDGPGLPDETYAQKKQWAFEMAEKMPNLVGFYLDDYFHGRTPPEGQEDLRASLTLDQLRDLRSEMNSLKRPTDLAAVLYSHQLHPGIKRHIAVCDVVSFWVWSAGDLAALGNIFKQYRELVPDKPTLLGIYMWDFGGKKPVTKELMKAQLDFALEQFKKGQIEGLIFHCTSLCNNDIEAVEYSKKWIAEYGEETIS